MNRTRAAYALASIVGLGSFLYPFWLPQDASSFTAHSADAPFVAGMVGLLAVTAIVLELRNGSMAGADVALLGMLSAMAGLLRLLDLPGGGSGIFFFVLLAAVAFGPRFGFLLGLFSMATGAVITGGIGPWLPYQMLVLGWLGAAFGVLGRATRRLDPRVEVAVVAAASWLAAFGYGLVINLWSWPLTPGEGDLQWNAALDASEVLRHYWSFYVASSLAWDAAGAMANLIAIALLGRPVLRSLRRFSHRLDPVTELEAGPTPAATAAT